MANPTRFPNGLSTRVPPDPLGNFGMPDPTRYHTWFNDFDSYTAGDWTVTSVGAGGTRAIGNLDGGILVVTNTALAPDSTYLQWAGGSGATKETFKFVAGKKLWFKSRFKLSDALESVFFMGLAITDTTPLDATDGVYMIKADGAAALSTSITKASTTTSMATGTLVTDTYAEAGFYYDGKQTFSSFFNGNEIASAAYTNMPTTEELSLTFGVGNGEAVAKVLSVDYMFVAKER